jgi:hypothetical protein
VIRWLYAVAPESSPSAPIASVCGRALEAHAHRGLRLIFETCPHAPEPSRDNLLAYGRVLQQLCARGHALPFRFGMTALAEQNLDDLLATHVAEWNQRLDIVRGCAELIAHVDATTPLAAAMQRTGTHYLKARAETIRQAQAQTASLSRELGQIAREIRPLPERSSQARVACLVALPKLEAFRGAFEAWRSSSRTHGAWLTGPWPPLSFAMEPEPS